MAQKDYARGQQGLANYNAAYNNYMKEEEKNNKPTKTGIQYTIQPASVVNQNAGQKVAQDGTFWKVGTNGSIEQFKGGFEEPKDFSGLSIEQGDGTKGYYDRIEKTEKDRSFSIENPLTQKGEDVEKRAETIVPALFEKNDDGTFKYDAPALSKLRNQTTNLLDPTNNADFKFLDRMSNEASGKEGELFDLSSSNVEKMDKILSKTIFNPTDGSLNYVPDKDDLKKSASIINNMSRIYEKSAKSSTVSAVDYYQFFNKMQKDMDSENKLPREDYSEKQIIIPSVVDNKVKFIPNPSVPYAKEYIKENQLGMKKQTELLENVININIEQLGEFNPQMFKRIMMNNSVGLSPDQSIEDLKDAMTDFELK